MKKMLTFLFLFLVTSLIAVNIQFIIKKNVSLINISSEDVVSIGITEYKGQSIIIQDVNTIKELMNQLSLIRATKSFWSFGTPENWDFRISIYTASQDNLDQLAEYIYLSYHGTAYKRNYSYQIDGFDSEYIKSLLDQN